MNQTMIGKRSRPEEENNEQCPYCDKYPRSMKVHLADNHTVYQNKNGSYYKGGKH